MKKKVVIATIIGIAGAYFWRRLTASTKSRLTQVRHEPVSLEDQKPARFQEVQGSLEDLGVSETPQTENAAVEQELAPEPKPKPKPKPEPEPEPKPEVGPTPSNTLNRTVVPVAQASSNKSLFEFQQKPNDPPPSTAMKELRLEAVEACSIQQMIESVFEDITPHDAASALEDKACKFSNAIAALFHLKHPTYHRILDRGDRLYVRTYIRGARLKPGFGYYESTYRLTSEKGRAQLFTRTYTSSDYILLEILRTGREAPEYLYARDPAAFHGSDLDQILSEAVLAVNPSLDIFITAPIYIEVTGPVQPREGWSRTQICSLFESLLPEMERVSEVLFWADVRRKCKLQPGNLTLDKGFYAVFNENKQKGNLCQDARGKGGSCIWRRAPLR